MERSLASNKKSVEWPESRNSQGFDPSCHGRFSDAGSTWLQPIAYISWSLTDEGRAKSSCKFLGKVAPLSLSNSAQRSRTAFRDELLCLAS